MFKKRILKIVYSLFYVIRIFYGAKVNVSTHKTVIISSQKESVRSNYKILDLNMLFLIIMTSIIENLLTVIIHYFQITPRGVGFV